MRAPIQLLLRQIDKVSYTFSAAKSWYIFKNWLKFKCHKNTCSMMLLELVPWWTETGREGRRWSLIWCRQWGRCWSSWAHRHCSCLQTIFSPDCRLHIVSWQCSNVCSSSSLSLLSLLCRSPLLLRHCRVWRGLWTAPTSNFAIIKYSTATLLECFLYVGKSHYIIFNIEMSSHSLPGAFK